MSETGLRAMARSRTLFLGHFIVEFTSPGIGHLLKNAGCEFALFDLEHSGFHFETVKSVLRYFEAAQLPAIVRVPSSQYHHLARAADMGAEGIMVPMVSGGEEAQAIARAVRYVPDGHRGVALGIAHDGYRPGPVPDKLAAANARTAVFAQIETAEGVAQADAIAAVDGIDCLWIGHFDLSCSLGIPGDFEHPRFREAVDTVLAACAKHGKAPGRLVPDVASAVALARAGFTMVCYSGDVWTYQSALRSGFDEIRRQT